MAGTNLRSGCQPPTLPRRGVVAVSRRWRRHRHQDSAVAAGEGEWDSVVYVRGTHIGILGEPAFVEAALGHLLSPAASPAAPAAAGAPPSTQAPSATP